MTLRTRFIETGKLEGALPNPFVGVPSRPLKEYDTELTRVATAIEIERKRVGQIRSLVSEALSARAPGVRIGLHVTEHAICRYLERYKGFDTNAIAAEIFDLYKSGAKEVCVKNGIVVTVLPKGQSNVLKWARNRDRRGRFVAGPLPKPADAARAKAIAMAKAMGRTDLVERLEG